MKLRKILEKIDYNVLKGDEDICINNIVYDSREAKEGDAFFCIEGFNVDGHKYISDAIKNGAIAVICSKNNINLDYKCTFIKVEDSRKALAIASANYYNHSNSKLKLIGVTGTNGKTTSTFMIKSILEADLYKVGLIGTIANYINNKKIHTDRTTPESLELHKLFYKMANEQVDYCVMEVSSHSLSLDRVYGLQFNQGIFTNLTREHLDFHKTFQNYYESKLLLFEKSNNSIINIDDNYGKKMYNNINGNKMTYSIDSEADVTAENIKLHSSGVEFDLKYMDESVHINMNIPGRYNVYNALCSAAACLKEGITLKTIKKGLEEMDGVPGRCELISKDYNIDFDIIIDYAHTPDGLENVLNTAKEFTKGQLISVFGCGGDRDKTKRPIMGKIGTELSDLAIITSDNPRTEDPLLIIDDIVKGINKDNYMIEQNRKEAIRKAIQIAKKDDVILIAGKGHEDYQILKDETIKFDEREVIAEIIKELF